MLSVTAADIRRDVIYVGACVRAFTCVCVCTCVTVCVCVCVCVCVGQQILQHANKLNFSDAIYPLHSPSLGTHAISADVYETKPGMPFFSHTTSHRLNDVETCHRLSDVETCHRLSDEA